MDAMYMTAQAYRDMVGHCIKEKPLEACGLLSGRDGIAARCWRIRNAERSPVAFTMDGEELTRALHGMKSLGEQLLGMYHSHPSGSPYPSPFDVEHAAFSCSYLIISLRRMRPRVRSFRLAEGTIREEQILLINL
ncbi:M67 family metallopeptidase [Paenibacillus thiaminolyticus]|uniref:M67 family metallopeptidase n=1 Tax=Paenibacillus thiaminolyticus TaxID=49283 RepID=A0AAP9J1A4_PANTH|nr:M67 family metallopeptidase [Paenibacillus thiaminolyticus]MCY9535725.1 M67 family metallopeptidase [Paenibacillus thiaminolyticus]MCY9601083.1 M67 family metallopeptidase [Paenibacillus thiaminolyticus]MCY9609528.1 M67 family metallopeptidase [Paenibacillus thiaminolyticus]MCY9613198.1 M67 family metallopeptidase [Paenibacillus thiaminolyticus]MCY9617613.1 M67 family metallopeptidase [Paenibacillus thiaminolyticus]